MQSASHNKNYENNMYYLVQLYQQHPCLYVVESVDYHNKIKRERALSIITNEFNNLTGVEHTIDEISKKIHNVRTQYADNKNKIKKSMNSGAGTDEIYKPKWFLFESLSFLDQHTKARESESSLQNSFKKVSEKNTVFDVDDNSQDDLMYLDVVNSLKSQKQQKLNEKASLTTNKTASSFSPSCLSYEDDMAYMDDCETLKNQKQQKLREAASSISSQASSSLFSTPNLTKKLNKKRKTDDQSYLKEELIRKAETALSSLTATSAEVIKERDGLHHWILYLESELREIKDKKKLKEIQRKIINMVMTENND